MKTLFLNHNLFLKKNLRPEIKKKITIMIKNHGGASQRIPT